MQPSTPTAVRRRDPKRVVIEWADGHVSTFTTPQLRGVCPCAACVNELTGQRMHDPRSVPEDLEHTDVRMVGNYAIALQFADGHNTGIFTWTLLRELDPDAA
jgi:ATP-binding protein involved in chromosome partitioning